jgi:geranylgeranyl diphosphate synthase type I
MHAEALSPADIEHWRTLIVATGAPAWVEDMISERVADALDLIADARIDDRAQTRLARMADLCTRRTA